MRDSSGSIVTNPLTVFRSILVTKLSIASRSSFSTKLSTAPSRPSGLRMSRFCACRYSCTSLPTSTFSSRSTAIRPSSSTSTYALLPLAASPSPPPASAAEALALGELQHFLGIRHLAGKLLAEALRVADLLVGVLDAQAYQGQRHLALWVALLELALGPVDETTDALAQQLDDVAAFRRQSSLFEFFRQHHVVHHKRTHRLERDGFDEKVGFLDVDNGDALFDGLALAEAGGDAAAGLGDVVALLGDRLRLDHLLVFVAPHHQVDRVVEHGFGHACLGIVRHAILVHAQNVEPRVWILLRPIHAHAVGAQLKVHALVLDVAHAVQREPRVALLQQHWKVVAGQGAVVGVAEQLHGNRLVSERILAQQGHCLMERRSTRLVLVKQIASEQDEIHIVLHRELEDLLECADRVLPAHGVALHVADVVIGGEHDLDVVRLALGRKRRRWQLLLCGVHLVGELIRLAMSRTIVEEEDAPGQGADCNGCGGMREEESEEMSLMTPPWKTQPVRKLRRGAGGIPTRVSRPRPTPLSPLLLAAKNALEPASLLLASGGSSQPITFDLNH
ncbi:hypothetical protein L1887_48205 [Cichorium endivia]|nr:hypothetical protein L1887_48205 [Cichorium endivia]